MTKLFEGMRAGDLEDLVLPLLSVDEYESKVDEDAIVFALYVSDFNAANDLNRYIQKSPVPLLDTEVSPAPDQRGHYLVFFELLSNDKLVKNVSQVLDEIAPLADVQHWDMQVRGVKDLVPFSEAALAKHFGNVKSQTARTDEMLAFLQPSGLSDARATKSHLILEGSGYQSSFEIIAFGPESELSCTHKLEEAALDLDLVGVAKVRRLLMMLGEGWSVARIGGMSVVQREGAETILLLRD